MAVEDTPKLPQRLLVDAEKIIEKKKAPHRRGKNSKKEKFPFMNFPPWKMFVFVRVRVLCAWEKLEFGSEEKVFVSSFHDEGKYVWRTSLSCTDIQVHARRSHGKQESFCWVENDAIFRSNTRSLFGEFGTLSHTTHRAVLWLYVTNLRLNFVCWEGKAFCTVSRAKLWIRLLNEFSSAASIRRLSTAFPCSSSWIVDLMEGNLKHWNSTPGVYTVFAALSSSRQ